MLGPARAKVERKRLYVLSTLLSLSHLQMFLPFAKCHRSYIYHVCISTTRFLISPDFTPPHLL